MRHQRERTVDGLPFPPARLGAVAPDLAPAACADLGGDRTMRLLLRSRLADAGEGQAAGERPRRLPPRIAQSAPPTSPKPRPTRQKPRPWRSPARRRQRSTSSIAPSRSIPTMRRRSTAAPCSTKAITSTTSRSPISVPQAGSIRRRPSRCSAAPSAISRSARSRRRRPISMRPQRPIRTTPRSGRHGDRPMSGWATRPRLRRPTTRPSACAHAMTPPAAAWPASAAEIPATAQAPS